MVQSGKRTHFLEIFTKYLFRHRPWSQWRRKRGSPDTGTEIPLQTEVKLVKQLRPCSPWRSTVERESPTACGKLHDGAGEWTKESYSVWSLCLEDRLPAGPVAPQREENTQEVCCDPMGHWPERLDPMEGICAGTVYEELLFEGRTYDKKVGGGLSPVGGIWCTTPFPVPLQCCHRGLEQIQSKAKPGKKGRGEWKAFVKIWFVFILIWLAIN